VCEKYLKVIKILRIFVIYEYNICLLLFIAIYLLIIFVMKYFISDCPEMTILLLL